MDREYWFFLGGALFVLLPLALAVIVKKFDLVGERPDEKIAYTSVAGSDLYLHAFRAVEATTPAPAVLLFHGGGWRYGNPAQFYPQCRFFARQGYACYTAQYRLGPVHAPDIAGAIQDAAAALDYLRQHAAELGIDARRITVGGGSSGGHLAAALGVGLHGAGRPRPAALLLYNPVLDLAPCTAAHYLAGDDWRAVSPQQHVGSGVPPTLILSGSADREVPPSMLQAFCAGVLQHGGHCEIELYDGQHHGFFNYNENDTSWFERTSERALQFLADRS